MRLTGIHAGAPTHVLGPGDQVVQARCAAGLKCTARMRMQCSADARWHSLSWARPEMACCCLFTARMGSCEPFVMREAPSRRMWMWGALVMISLQ